MGLEDGNTWQWWYHSMKQKSSSGRNRFGDTLSIPTMATPIKNKDNPLRISRNSYIEWLSLGAEIAFILIWVDIMIDVFLQMLEKVHDNSKRRDKGGGLSWSLSKSFMRYT